jgi:O-antigen/teichoic acid export membrane protein
MSEIRKKSLKATAWIYVGFLIGAVNTYFLTHKNWFTTDQNGLTRAMIETSQLIFAFSCLGTTTFLYKFFPYYKDNLDDKKNDMLSLALITSLIGFFITCTGLYFLQPLIERKFSANSILFVRYFFWIVPLGFFVLLYNILESYALGFGKGVLTSLLKETILRFYTFCIITLKILELISFRSFIILFSLQYAIIVTILVIHLYKNNQLWLSFQLSRVTKKFRKKILSVMLLTFFVVIVGVLRQSIDGIVLAAKQNLGKVGIFGLASYMVSIIQAPYRSLIAITIPLLSRAWKDKNQAEIQRIYQRSSINMLSFSLFVFFCVWLNFENGIHFFNINPDYLEGKYVFFLLGLVTIIEMGFGVNGQIIGTSTFWRFELWTSLLLTTLIIPLSYLLTVRYGIIGPAIANLISFSIYNSIRYYFLWAKFRLQPFSMKTIELLLISIVSYTIAYFCTLSLHGMPAIVFSITIFIVIFLPLVFYRNITPDIKPVKDNLLKRLKFIRKD